MVTINKIKDLGFSFTLSAALGLLSLGLSGCITVDEGYRIERTDEIPQRPDRRQTSQQPRAEEAAGIKPADCVGGVLTNTQDSRSRKPLRRRSQRALEMGGAGEGGNHGMFVREPSGRSGRKGRTFFGSARSSPRNTTACASRASRTVSPVVPMYTFCFFILLSLLSQLPHLL